MSDDEDYSSGSDEDYVPDAGEIVSEEENSGEEEDLDGLKEDAGEDGTGFGKANLGKRKKKKAGGIQPRKRRGGIKVEGEESEEDEDDTYNKDLQEEMKKEQTEKKEEVERKRSDDLWSSFLSDVGTRPKSKPAPPSTSTGSLASLSKPVQTSQKSSGSSSTTKAPSTGKLTVTKEYDFAGETVRVTKDVDVNSKEGQIELKKLQGQDSSEKTKDATATATQGTAASPGLSYQMPKKPAGGGLSSVLSKLGKKDKISTLEKSKLDWESFKQKEGIDEELKIHNRGKEGYIERMQFLNRTDHRQFERERDLRLATSSKR